MTPDLTRAACRDADPELFFDPDREPQALAYCAACPVAMACLKLAWPGPVPGVWGGTTADMRGHREAPSAAGRPSRKPVQHGTRGGFDRHKRAGETPCEACREVEREYQRERHQRRVKVGVG